MNRTRSFIASVFLVVLTVISGSGVAYLANNIGPDVALFFDPSAINANIGDSFAVAVNVTNIVTLSLAKWSMTIEWNASVVELDLSKPPLSPNANTGFAYDQYVPGSGVLSRVRCALAIVIKGGVLIRLHFKAVAGGNTTIRVTNSSLINSLSTSISHRCEDPCAVVVGSVSDYHNVALTALSIPTSLISGQSVPLSAVVTNKGSSDETNVGVMLYVNNSLKGSSSFDSLAAGSNVSCVFQWLIPSQGMYNITVYVPPVTGESYDEDNQAMRIVYTSCHDLSVSLECSEQFVIGDLVPLKAIITNVGAYVEANATVELMIDGVVKNVTSVESLTVNSTSEVTYLWEPPREGSFNITAYAIPVAGEDFVTNNNKSILVNVDSLVAQSEILIVADDDGVYHRRGTSLNEFASALSNAGAEYETWVESINGRPLLNDLLRYKVVIWTCGDFSGTAVDYYDSITVRSYFEMGGNLILEGGSIGFDHIADALMNNVAHAVWRTKGNNAIGLEVLQMHPITEGLPHSFTWGSPPLGDDGVAAVHDGLALLSYSGTLWTALTCFDGSASGIGSAVYFSFPLSCLGDGIRELLVKQSVEWLLRYCVSTVLGKVIHAEADSVWFVYADSATQTPCLDIAAGSMIYAKCENTQIQGFTSSLTWFEPTGEINATELGNKTVVLFGNRFSNAIVDYYEKSEMTHIVTFENSTHYILKDRAGNTVISQAKDPLESGHEDTFVIEVFKDSDRDFLVLYGLGLKGSWAAGICFADKMLTELQKYQFTDYIFKWIDGNADGVPQAVEINQVAPLES